MTNPIYDIDASCGGKRRGCCLIELPNDDEPADVVANSCTQRILLIVSGLPSGGSPGGQMVLIVNPKATGGDSKTDR
jgi:hypothetical protein